MHVYPSSFHKDIWKFKKEVNRSHQIQEQEKGKHMTTIRINSLCSTFKFDSDLWHSKQGKSTFNIVIIEISLFLIEGIFDIQHYGIS